MSTYAPYTQTLILLYFLRLNFIPKELLDSIKLKPIHMLSQIYHPKAILADTNYQC